MEIPIVGKQYIYKKDGRIITATIVQEKYLRVEVIIGKWNPFFVNFSDLEEIGNGSIVKVWTKEEVEVNGSTAYKYVI